jgi:hypothetical protein
MNNHPYSSSQSINLAIYSGPPRKVLAQEEGARSGNIALLKLLKNIQQVSKNNFADSLAMAVLPDFFSSLTVFLAVHKP